MNTRPERLNTVERCALWQRLVEFTCAAAVLATLIACNHAAYAEEHPVDTPEIVAQVITPPLPQSVLREFRVPKLKRKLSGRLAFSSRIGGLNRILVVDLGSRKVRSLILELI